MVYKLNAVVVQ